MATNAQADQEMTKLEGLEARRKQINSAFDAAYPSEGTEVTDEVRLLRAIKDGRFDDVKVLIENGFDPNTRDKINQSTLLHWATFQGRLDIVKYLVEKGADIKGQDGQGDTPVHEAAYWGHLPVLQYFIEEKNVDVEGLLNAYGETPLHRAIECDDFTREESAGKMEVIRYLVEGKHVDLNKKGPYNRSPLHWAAKYELVDMVKYLVDNGADINAKDNIGYTPLHTAADYGNVPVVRYLVEEANADVTAANVQGNTPLHMTIICGSDQPDAHERKLAVVKCLVESNRADVNAKGLIGNTPLHEAAISGSLEMIKYLVERGADVRAKNDEGDTPASVAAKERDNEIRFIDPCGEARPDDEAEAIRQTQDMIRKAIQKEKNEIADYLEGVAKGGASS